VELVQARVLVLVQDPGLVVELAQELVLVRVSVQVTELE
jgi:hypothetical protein